jgi:hypothetical protein
VAGDELVVVDFQGYVAGSMNSTLPDFVASISNALPAGLLMPPGFTDSSSIPDLVFTYAGPSFDTSGGLWVAFFHLGYTNPVFHHRCFPHRHDTARAGSPESGVGKGMEQ